MTNIRVRYAPSPTGHLHIGNARTALFNYLFARHMGGQLIIRIEDTDLKRNIAGGDQNQLDYLRWLGIDYDESIDIPSGDYGPYRQSERLHIYQQYATQLLDQGLAYKCYCTEEELEQERAEQQERGETPRYSGVHRHLTMDQQRTLEAQGRRASIRLKVPQSKVYSFHDMVKGNVSFESDGFGDYIIVKKDGMPTYNFAVVIDDYLMDISHVLRGDDHISNTPRQLMVYEALNWQPPIFGHMSLIVNEQRKKLSKRDESILQFIEQYHDLGYLPEALFNFIALLGWSPEGEEEIYSSQQLIEMFNVERLSKSPAFFDQEKLAWMNNDYVKKLSQEKVVQLTLPFLQQAGLIPDAPSQAELDWSSKLIVLYQEQMQCGADIVQLSSSFFERNVTYDQDAQENLQQEGVSTVLEAFKEKVDAIDAFLAGEIKAALKAVQKETGFKGKQLFMPVRAACTGQLHGRDLATTLELLGQEEISQRLARVLAGRT